jgi:hypothetical protein
MFLAQRVARKNQLVGESQGTQPMVSIAEDQTVEK